MVLVLLYFWEAYTCQTRQYISNALTSPEQVEQYMEELRQQPPIITWKLRAFHYQPSIWTKQKLLKQLLRKHQYLQRFCKTLLQGIPSNIKEPQQKQKQQQQQKQPIPLVHNLPKKNHVVPKRLTGQEDKLATTVDDDDDDNNNNNEKAPDSSYTLWPFPRKRVTLQVQRSNEYKHWVDGTLVAVWQRARNVAAAAAAAAVDTGGGLLHPSSTPLHQQQQQHHHHDSATPLAKLRLSKLLVLSNAKARRDYMAQQSKFIAQHCVDDTHAEFSTTIQIPGFHPRLLVLRPNSPRHNNDNKKQPKPQQQRNNNNKINNKRWSPSMGIALQFWFFTLLGLTVPYRMWLARQCDEIRVTVVKEIFADQQPSVSTTMSSSSSSSSSNNSNTNSNPGLWLVMVWNQLLGIGNTRTTRIESDMSAMKYPTERFRETMRRLALYKSTTNMASTTTTMDHHHHHSPGTNHSTTTTTHHHPSTTSSFVSNTSLPQQQQQQHYLIDNNSLSSSQPSQQPWTQPAGTNDTESFQKNKNNNNNETVEVSPSIETDSTIKTKTLLPSDGLNGTNVVDENRAVLVQDLREAVEAVELVQRVGNKLGRETNQPQ